MTTKSAIPTKTDLASIDTVAGSNEGFDVNITHPVTGDDLGITIHVLGKDSDEFRRISRSQTKRRLERMQKQGGGLRTAVPIEDIDRDGIELLAACTKSWDGVMLDGKVLECNKTNSSLIYERFPWIKEIIDSAIGDRANFIKG